MLLTTVPTVVQYCSHTYINRRLQTFTGGTNGIVSHKKYTTIQKNIKVLIKLADYQTNTQSYSDIRVFCNEKGGLVKDRQIFEKIVFYPIGPVSYRIQTLCTPYCAQYCSVPNHASTPNHAAPAMTQSSVQSTLTASRALR